MIGTASLAGSPWLGTRGGVIGLDPLALGRPKMNAGLVDTTSSLARLLCCDSVGIADFTSRPRRWSITKVGREVGLRPV